MHRYEILKNLENIAGASYNRLADEFLSQEKTPSLDSYLAVSLVGLATEPYLQLINGLDKDLYNKCEKHINKIINAEIYPLINKLVPGIPFRSVIINYLHKKVDIKKKEFLSVVTEYQEYLKQMDSFVKILENTNTEIGTALEQAFGSKEMYKLKKSKIIDSLANLVDPAFYLDSQLGRQYLSKYFNGIEFADSLAEKIRKFGAKYVEQDPFQLTKKDGNIFIGNKYLALAIKTEIMKPNHIAKFLSVDAIENLKQKKLPEILSERYDEISAKLDESILSKNISIPPKIKKMVTDYLKSQFKDIEKDCVTVLDYIEKNISQEKTTDPKKALQSIRNIFDIYSRIPVRQDFIQVILEEMLDKRYFDAIERLSDISNQI